MEERESTEKLFVVLKAGAKKKTILRVRERYKYHPKPQRSDKSWQCRGLSTAVPFCGIVALQVRHCRTKPDSKG